jgi:dGTP triphosphohydrolase
MKINFMKSSNDNLLNIIGNTSNEMEAAISDRIELYDYLRKVKRIRKKIKDSLFTENEKDAKKTKKRLNDLRAVLDNPVLNATVKWNSALSRGICDFIANLTDQEALNEYDRLYAGVMELV